MFTNISYFSSKQNRVCRSSVGSINDLGSLQAMQKYLMKICPWATSYDLVVIKPIFLCRKYNASLGFEAGFKPSVTHMTNIVTSRLFNRPGPRVIMSQFTSDACPSCYHQIDKYIFVQKFHLSLQYILSLHTLSTNVKVHVSCISYSGTGRN